MAGLAEDIVLGATDMTGAQIEQIYSKVSTRYAVYLTANRILIQFADDDTLGKQQREEFRDLNVFRSEINSLLDGWEGHAWGPSVERRAALVDGFNQRVAVALVLALQGDAANGKVQLQAVRDDLMAERISIGRLEYLMTAAGMGVALTALAMAIPGQFGTSWIGKYFFENQTSLAIGMGVPGTLFLIALFIRSRTINPDLRRRDNLVDAVLRIGIGAVSAVILFALLKGGIVSIKLGNTELKPGTDTTGVALAVSVVIAFLAGFSERLVGDVLGTAGLTSTGSASPVAPADDVGNAAGQDEDNPSGGGTVPVIAAAAAVGGLAASEIVTLFPEDTNDLSISDVPPTGDEITDESELPPAYGGVESSASRLPALNT